MSNGLRAQSMAPRPCDSQTKDNEHAPPVRRRSTSVPAQRGRDSASSFLRPRKPVLKVKSIDDSLRSTWESSSDVVKSVDWKDIQIRQYERTVGDNPSCSSGPPLSIGWEYDPKMHIMSIDGYEKHRPPRKSQFELVVPRAERQELLIEDWKVYQNCITAAIRSNIQAKNQRRQTVNNLGKATKFEELTESFHRKFKRALKREKRPSIIAADLERQHLAAEAQREELWLEVSQRDESSRHYAPPRSIGALDRALIEPPNENRDLDKDLIEPPNRNRELIKEEGAKT